MHYLKYGAIKLSSGVSSEIHKVFKLFFYLIHNYMFYTGNLMLFSLSGVQEKFKISQEKIFEFLKCEEFSIDGDKLCLKNPKAKEFQIFLLKFKANQLCQEANSLGAKKYYYDALVKYEEAQTIFDELGDKEGKYTCLNNIGLIFESLEDYHKALTSFREALDIAEVINDQLGVALEKMNIARIHNVEGRQIESLKFFEESLSILSQVDLPKPLYYLKEEVKANIEKIKLSLLE